jgi:hypothetical protein
VLVGAILLTVVRAILDSRRWPAGTIAASLNEPHKFFRHPATVAVYLLVLMGLYVTGLQQRASPPGTSFGGPNVPPP